MQTKKSRCEMVGITSEVRAKLEEHGITVCWNKDYKCFIFFGWNKYQSGASYTTARMSEGGVKYYLDNLDLFFHDWEVCQTSGITLNK